MADVKISQLPAATTPLTGTEQIPLVQGGTTKQVTASGLVSNTNLGTPTAVSLVNATNVPVNQATGLLPVANGGTGTASPSLVQGSNVTITGIWPNQTISAATSTGTVSNVATGTGLTGGPITTTGTIALANTAVTPGAYTSANITVDAQGRITSAANGTSGGVTAVTGTAPVVSSGGATPAISMAKATTSVDGYLSATDWNTFNNKQPAGSYLTSGGALGTPSSGTLTNTTGLPLTTGVTGVLPVANGGNGTATPALVAGTNVTITGTWPNQTINATGGGSGMIYPGAGIPNSTGSAWGTSYSTTGSGTVVALATSPTLVTPILGTPQSGNFSTGTFTWPTFNQNTTGTAANITATSNSTITTLSALSLPGSQVSGNISGNAGNVTGTVAVANGGTGTSTPALVAGTNVTITGTWPNQTINATGGGGMTYPGAGIAVSTGSAWTTSLTAPSGALVGTTDAQTLTNKRVNPRVSSTTSTSSITPDVSAFDQYCVTAQAATLTINAPTGTPVDGNKLIFRILDNGAPQTLTWNGTFTAIGATLPTTTTASKMTYVGCIYNAANTRWDVIAVTTQA